MFQNENWFNVDGNCHSMDHYGLFFSPSWLLLGQLGFLCPFTFMPKRILTKRKFNFVLPMFEPLTMSMPIQCTTIQPIHVS